MHNPQEYFENTQQRAQENASQFQAKYQQWALLRALYFIGGIVGLVWLANARMFTPFGISILLFIAGFMLLIRRHQALRWQRDQARLLDNINAEELARLQGNLRQLESGTEFQDSEHPYSGDLDVFGTNSLFQLTNRTTTPTGRSTLANWLQKAAKPAEITNRQKAIQELGPKVEQRQHWQVLGTYHAEKELNLAPIQGWLQQPDKASHPLWNMLRWVLPLLSISLYVCFALGIIPFGIASLCLIPNLIVLGKWFTYSLEVQKFADKSIQALKGYEALLKDLEQFPAASHRLKALQDPMQVDGTPASSILRKLKLVLDRFDSRANLVYILANLLFVLDLHGLIQAERWRTQYRSALQQWFDVVGEWEALASLAALHYSQPDWVFPTLVESGFIFESKQLGHPLIPAGKRVPNDFSLSDQGTVAVVTGSNMAGKSTFLRTVGVNAVLGYTGAPVCASQLHLSPMQVFTSMRTQDNLEASISSFFAELRRIRQLLDRLKASDDSVLFLLDEILKGTNSQDRHRGATGLVKQLHQKTAMGLISTHDLELGDLEGSVAGVVNYSFNSQVEGENIHFDYQLSHGICQEFNAAALMARMGIEVDTQG